MESSNVLGQEADEEGRLSELTVDILLSILGRVDLVTAARTSTLSKRWRSLPWLLPEFNLHVRDFLRAPCPDNPAHHMDQAMASLTKAARSFLAHHRSQRNTVTTRLSLNLYMTGTQSHDIGPLVSNAIDDKMVKELGLAIVDKKEPKDCRNEHRLQQARDVDGFFSAYPSVLHCLTTLHLRNVRFAEGDIHHLLFDSCKQLQHLSLDHCDARDCSVWQINAPDSNLRVLEVYFSCLKRVEVLCLPKLERLHWETWFYYETPCVLVLSHLLRNCASNVLQVFVNTTSV